MMFTIILVTSGSRLDPAACSVSVTIAHDNGVSDCDPAYSMPGRPNRDLQTPRHSRCEQKAAQRISESPKAPAPLRLARENQGGADMFGTSCSSIPHQAPRSHARSSSRIKAPTATLATDHPISLSHRRTSYWYRTEPGDVALVLHEEHSVQDVTCRPINNQNDRDDRRDSISRLITVDHPISEMQPRSAGRPGSRATFPNLSSNNKSGHQEMRKTGAPPPS